MSPEVIAAISAAVGTVGFPAFVAVFVLWRLERTLRGVQDRLSDVAAVIRTFREHTEVRVRRPPPEEH